MGKTRLLTSAAVEGRADGWHVLWGGAYELQGLSAYFPFVEAVRSQLDRAGPSIFERLAGHWRGPLAALIPELRDQRAPHVTAQPDKPTLFEAWAQLLRCLADDGPTLLLLDDLSRLVATYKLYDQIGTRLSVRGGEVVDGPFIETKEAIGGVFMIDAASLDEATALARECPVLRLQNGYVEVRPVER